MKVVLVEDNIGDARLIQEYFKEDLNSADLKIVNRLGRALEVIGSDEHIDVILLDLALPDSFGLETLTKVLSAVPKRKIPVIVLTCSNDKLIAAEAVRMGAQDYITKGFFNGESLARTIQYAIERSRAEKVILNQERALLLSSKLTAMGELTAFIIHEILNPVNAISLSCQILSEKSTTQDLELLQIIERNLTRIQKITTNMSSFVRGTGHEPHANVSLDTLLSGVVELCSHRFKAKSIPFELETPQTLVEFSCRENQIVQVLVNLLNNSFDAVKNLPEKWVKFRVFDRENLVEFSIMDSGPGIPEDLVNKILDTFFTTKENDGGTGLGLSISKRIISEHGGSLEIDQQCPNTHFVVRIPKFRELGMAT